MDDITAFVFLFSLIEVSLVLRVFLSQKDSVLLIVTGTFKKFVQLIISRLAQVPGKVPLLQQMSQDRAMMTRSCCTKRSN